MNIVLNAHNIDIDNCIQFLDAKMNNIMDGKFTKMLYSDEYTSLNGLYVLCNLTRFTGIPIYKNNFVFCPNTSTNYPIIQQMILLEKRIILLYKQYTGCNKKHIYLLQNQLHSGTIKVYQENIIKFDQLHSTHLSMNPIYVIKISGIWETSDTIGITYKFLEMYR